MRSPIGFSIVWLGLAAGIVTVVVLHWHSSDVARSAPPVYECQQLNQQCIRDCADMFPSHVPDYQPQVDLCQSQAAAACEKYARICAEASPAPPVEY